jgi:hypothetical protein
MITEKRALEATSLLTPPSGRVHSHWLHSVCTRAHVPTVENREAGLSPACLLNRHWVTPALDTRNLIVTHPTNFVKREAAESGGVEPHPPLDGPSGYQALPFTGTVHSPTVSVSAGTDVIHPRPKQTRTKWH